MVKEENYDSFYTGMAIENSDGIAIAHVYKGHEETARLMVEALNKITDLI